MGADMLNKITAFAMAVPIVLASILGTALAKEGPGLASLETAVAEFDTAMRENDFETVADTIPPPVMAAMAKRFGMAPAGLRMVLISQMGAMMADIELLEFGMDFEGVEIAETENGVPYAILPTRTRMRSPELGTVRGSSPTLAVSDGERWYLMRIDGEEQLAIIRSVYPGLEDVTFPRATIEFEEEEGGDTDG